MTGILQILGGFAIGYLIATFSESFLHAIVGHASERARAVWHRYPRLFHFMIPVSYTHLRAHETRYTISFDLL